MGRALHTALGTSTRPLLAVGVLTVAAACVSSRPPAAMWGEGVPWTELLPPCPCMQPPADVVGDGWAMDASSCAAIHPGADACFRSYPAVRTIQGRSGQQCCYDHRGSLITSGSGAGTPGPGVQLSRRKEERQDEGSSARASRSRRRGRAALGSEVQVMAGLPRGLAAQQRERMRRVPRHTTRERFSSHAESTAGRGPDLQSASDARTEVAPRGF